MYSPLGYIPAISIFEKFYLSEEIAEAWKKSVGHPIHIVIGTPGDLLRWKFYSFFQDHFYVYTLSGELLKIDSTSLFEHRLWIGDLSTGASKYDISPDKIDSFLGDSELQSKYSFSTNFSKITEVNFEAFLDEFMTVYEQHGEQVAKADLKQSCETYCDEFDSARPWLLVSDDKFTIDLTMYRRLDSFFEPEELSSLFGDEWFKIRRAAETFSALDGGTICIREEGLPKLWEKAFFQGLEEDYSPDLDDLLEIDDDGEISPKNTSKARNEAIREFLEYMQENPDAKITKAEAKKLFGRDVSQNVFKGQVWRTVADKYPHLSLPGRKS